MRSKGLTLQIIQLLITVIILYTITAIVPRLISTYLKTYFYLAVLALCVLLVMVSRGRSSIDEYVILIIPFAIWKVIIYFVDKPSLIDWGYSALLDFIPIILGLFITKRLDKKYIRYFSVVILLAIFVTALTTYIGLVENPDAARYMATVSDPNESKYIRYNMMNIGGYNFIYYTVLLIRLPYTLINAEK